MKEKNTTVGQTYVQRIENGVKDLIADRILPKDFVIKEFCEDYAWGMNEEIVVMWDTAGHAMSVEIGPDAPEYAYLSYDDEKSEWKMIKGVELWPNAIFDLI